VTDVLVSKLASDRAVLTGKEINDLPDTSFAYIEPGGSKDAGGKTMPRSKRHFPIHDAAHVRDALARAPQSPYGKAAMPKILAAAKKFGVSASQSNSATHAPDIDVIRAMDARGPELRAAEAADSPGTFADTIAKDRGIMRSLFDHGHDPQIGNKVLGPIVALREDATSPVGEVQLLDTGYNRDLLPGLKAGVYGSSFRMHVQADDWDDNPPRSEHNPDGIPERTITRVRALEFGPVTFPANPAATATVRSGTDYYYDQLRNRDTSAFEAAARAAGWVPADLTGRPNAWSVGGGDSGGRPDSQKPAFNHRQRLDDGALRTRGII
jgi:hypothetical protein